VDYLARGGYVIPAHELDPLDVSDYRHAHRSEFSTPTGQAGLLGGDRR